MRIVVTGGRNYRNRVRVFHALDQIDELNPITALAEGGAAGADDYARAWAELHGIERETFWANWDLLGAGPARNRAMLEQFRPHLVVAFPGGKGTAHCVRTAHRMGLSVLEVQDGGKE